MRRGIRLFIGAFVGVFLLSGTSFGWQGRMAGMGNPFGLVEDESDFLINPAKIVDGQGIRYYSNYQFTYGDVSGWDWGAASPNLASSSEKRTSGTEYFHDVLVGAGFPVANGRMGLFFNYSGKRADYDGRAFTTAGSNANIDMGSDFDNFALRLMYGRHYGDIKAGGEIQITHRRDENRSTNTLLLFDDVTPFLASTNDFLGDLLPFMTPHDSTYWEIAAKKGIEKDFGKTRVGLTGRGGYVFTGDTDWSGNATLLNFIDFPFQMKGDVDGWNVGGDFWVRHHYSSTLSLPFVVRLDYSDRSRSGAGTGEFWGAINAPFAPASLMFSSSDLGSFESNERLFQVEVGGGIDLALSSRSRVAAGLYYNYIDRKNSVNVASSSLAANPFSFNYGDMPHLTEHLARVKLAGETRLFPEWTLRGGLDFFAGIANEDLGSFLVPDSTSPAFDFSSSMDGTHWGITASIGTTTRWKGMTIEPFFRGGYQEIKLRDGNAQSLQSLFAWEVDKYRGEAVFCFGVSVLF